VDGWRFKRQVPIGPYVVDFVCLSGRLIVEADGPVHDAAEQRIRDAERDCAAWKPRLSGAALFRGAYPL